jgi:hypothetical protein
MNRERGARAGVRHAAALVVLLLAAGTGLLAQDASDAEEGPGVSLWRRFQFGVTMSVPVNGIIREGETRNTETVTSGKTTTTIVTTIKNESTVKRVGGGVALFFDLNERFAIGTNVIYHRIGYDRTKTRESTVSAATGTTTETEIEKTKAAYWDIPVLTRIRLAEIRPLRTRVFFTGGANTRLTRGIDTLIDAQPVTLPGGGTTGASDTYRTPAVPDARTTFGPVVGGGFQWQDDTGLRLTPEFRYTRWFNRTWDRGPTRSAGGQIEFVLSLTF